MKLTLIKYLTFMRHLVADFVYEILTITLKGGSKMFSNQCKVTQIEFM